MIRIIRVEVDARQFVANLGCADGVALRQACIEDLHFEFRCLEGVALERIRHCHRAQCLPVGIGGSHCDRLGEMLVRLGVVALEIKRRSNGQMRLVQIRGLVECLTVEGQRVIQLAVAAQFLALLHQVDRTAGSRGWRGGGLLGVNKRGEQERNTGSADNTPKHEASKFWR